jgi:signal transduction histidine kinase
MSSDRRKSGVPDFLEAVGGRYVLSWQVAVASFPFTVATTVVPGWAISGATSPLWFLAGTVAHVAMIVGAIPIRLWLLPAKARRSRPALAIMTFVYLGLIRGVVMLVLTREWELETARWAFRLIGGPVIMVITLSLLVAAIDSRERHARAVKELSATEAALIRSRAEAELVLQRERLQLIDTVTQTIRIPLARLHAAATAQGQGPEAANEMIQQIDHLLDVAVKPLSRAMASNIDGWIPSQIHEVVSVRPRLRDIPVERPLYPLAQAVASASVLPATVAALHSYFTSAIAGLLVGLSAFAVLWAADRWWMTDDSLPLGRSIRHLLPVYILAGLPSVLVVNVVGIQERLHGVFVAGVTLIIIATGIVIAVTSATHQQRLRREEELRQVNAELAVGLAAISSELWMQRRRIAEFLHGDVQSGLILAATRLSQGQDGVHLIAPIEHALDRLATADAERTPMTVFLGELQQSWAGVIDISVDADRETLDFCDVHAGLQSLSQLSVQELVTNAARHGRARAANVSMALMDDFVHICVRDNGDGLKDGPPGLGSGIIEAASSSWSRARVDGWTVVSVTLPAPAVPSPRMDLMDAGSVRIES